MNRVLVVDDEDLILDTWLRKQSRKFGFRAITAKSATEALSIFHDEQTRNRDYRFESWRRCMDGVSLCSRIRYEDKSVVVRGDVGVFF